MVSQALADAVYHTVHDNGGPTKIGPRLGLQPSILSNKANPRQRHNRLTLAESLQLQQVTGDHRILHAEAQELGYIVIPIENPPPSDVELLTLYAQWQDRTGRIHHAIADAFDNPRITAPAHREIKRRFFDAAQSGLTYLHRMGGMVQ